MTQFFFFGFQISGVVRVYLGPDWYLFHHLHPVAFESDDFLWIVSQKTEFTDDEIEQDLRA